MTEREDAATLLLRNVALLVDGHLDLGTAAHRATVPETVRALRQALDVLVAVGLDALLRDPGLAAQSPGGVGGVGIVVRRRRRVTMPEIPAAAISRSTRFLPTRTPWPMRSSAWIRLAP